MRHNAEPAAHPGQAKTAAQDLLYDALQQLELERGVGARRVHRPAAHEVAVPHRRPALGARGRVWPRVRHAPDPAVATNAAHGSGRQSVILWPENRVRCGPVPVPAGYQGHGVSEEAGAGEAAQVPDLRVEEQALSQTRQPPTWAETPANFVESMGTGTRNNVGHYQCRAGCSDLLTA